MIYLISCVFILLPVSYVTSVKPQDPTCGYQSCNAVKDDMINVHLVPHTHDDVGWLKTVDQYFYGSKTYIQNAGVQYVLDSVIKELLADHARRFIYVEIAFFARWWRQQGDSMQQAVKGLVNSGQLEFILGGWCMNDEAATHYNDIIDQHSLGFEFLRQNFGDCARPRVGWQIDPFGHSRETASLFAQFGFDGLFFGRLDYQDKALRLNQSTMEMLWHGSPDNLKENADLFTGVLYNGYGPPRGFCFDQFCRDDPVMDDDRLHDYNVEQMIDNFISAVQDQYNHYITNHVMMTMGSDFQYQNAHHWYKNMDKLIQYTNMLQQTNNSKINVLYSTPSCYLYQLNKAGMVWPEKSDDFFPLASGENKFWTGFYTSRSALKAYIRETNTFSQACRQLDALAMLTDNDNSTESIQILKEAMGVAQHHDGVSGTEKQHVANDYAMRLAHGRAECQTVMNDAIGKLATFGKEPFPGIKFCDLLNISACDIIEQRQRFVTTLYNPLGRPVTRWLRLPVTGQAYVVHGPNGEQIETQIIPVTERTKEIPARAGSLATNELVFQASLPPLGFNSYFVSNSSGDEEEILQTGKQQQELNQDEDFVMQNEYMALRFDGRTGKLKGISNLASGLDLPFAQELAFYYSHPGYCSSPSDIVCSGAYVFRPNTSTAQTFGPPSSRTIIGPLVQEIYTEYSPWATQVTRLYTSEKYAEIEWTVGPIPTSDRWGKEVIATFNTGMDSFRRFYTDANGREVLQRIRNHRDTWQLNQTEPVAGNYFPVNSRIYIVDYGGNKQLTVMTDRSLGGSSIEDGQMEIMLHRRLVYDDCLGVGEPLDETGSDGQGLIVRGKLFVFMDTIENSGRLHRDFGLRQYMAAIPTFMLTDMQYAEYAMNFYTSWSGLTRPLPDNVHLLTLEQWGGPTIFPEPTKPYLIRLENFYALGEDPNLSQNVTISLDGLFAPFQIKSIFELTLGANMDIYSLNRLKWNSPNRHKYNVVESENSSDIKKKTRLNERQFDVLLTPMQIRTFQVILQNGEPASTKDKFTVFS